MKRYGVKTNEDGLPWFMCRTDGTGKSFWRIWSEENKNPTRLFKHTIKVLKMYQDTPAELRETWQKCAMWKRGALIRNILTEDFDYPAYISEYRKRVHDMLLETRNGEEAEVIHGFLTEAAIEYNDWIRWNAGEEWAKASLST